MCTAGLALSFCDSWSVCLLTQRWIKQLEDESCSASVEDGTDSTSSQQSTSSRSTPNPLSGGTYFHHRFGWQLWFFYFSCNHPHKKLYFTELNVPFKKRHARYVTGATPTMSDHLLRPLSPITPPLPEEGLHPLLHDSHGSLLTNGLAYSPLPSLPVGCCNTTLQFEVSSWILLLCQATVHSNTIRLSARSCWSDIYFTNQCQLVETTRGICFYIKWRMFGMSRLWDCVIINLIQPYRDSYCLFFSFCRTYRHQRPHQFTGHSPSLLRFVLRPQLLSKEHNVFCLTLYLCLPLFISPDGPGWSSASVLWHVPPL